MTHRETALIEAYARTGDATYSAKIAGYRGPSGATMALARPTVQQRIEALRSGKLLEAATIAVDCLLEIVRDTSLAAAPRVSAGDKLLKGAGLYRPSTQGTDRDPSEMSAGELNEYVIRQLDAANQAAAVIIEGEVVHHTPTAETSSDQIERAVTKIPSGGVFD